MHSIVRRCTCYTVLWGHNSLLLIQDIHNYDSNYDSNKYGSARTEDMSCRAQQYKHLHSMYHDLLREANYMKGHKWTDTFPKHSIEVTAALPVALGPMWPCTATLAKNCQLHRPAGNCLRAMIHAAPPPPHRHQTTQGIVGDLCRCESHSLTYLRHTAIQCSTAQHGTA